MRPVAGIKQLRWWVKALCMAPGPPTSDWSLLNPEASQKRLLKRKASEQVGDERARKTVFKSEALAKSEWSREDAEAEEANVMGRARVVRPDAVIEHFDDLVVVRHPRPLSVLAVLLKQLNKTSFGFLRATRGPGNQCYLLFTSTHTGEDATTFGGTVRAARFAHVARKALSEGTWCTITDMLEAETRLRESPPVMATSRNSQAPAARLPSFEDFCVHTPSAPLNTTLREACVDGAPFTPRLSVNSRSDFRARVASLATARERGKHTIFKLPVDHTLFPRFDDFLAFTYRMGSSIQKDQALRSGPLDSMWRCNYSPCGLEFDVYPSKTASAAVTLHALLGDSSWSKLFKFNDEDWQRHCLQCLQGLHGGIPIDDAYQPDCKSQMPEFRLVEAFTSTSVRTQDSRVAVTCRHPLTILTFLLHIASAIDNANQLRVQRIYRHSDTREFTFLLEALDSDSAVRMKSIIDKHRQFEMLLQWEDTGQLFRRALHFFCTAEIVSSAATPECLLSAGAGVHAEDTAELARLIDVLDERTPTETSKSDGKLVYEVSLEGCPETLVGAACGLGVLTKEGEKLSVEMYPSRRCLRFIVTKCPFGARETTIWPNIYSWFVKKLDPRRPDIELSTLRLRNHLELDRDAKAALRNQSVYMNDLTNTIDVVTSGNAFVLSHKHPVSVLARVLDIMLKLNATVSLKAWLKRPRAISLIGEVLSHGSCGALMNRLRLQLELPGMLNPTCVAVAIKTLSSVPLKRAEKEPSCSLLRNLHRTPQKTTSYFVNTEPRLSGDRINLSNCYKGFDEMPWSDLNAEDTKSFVAHARKAAQIIQTSATRHRIEVRLTPGAVSTLRGLVSLKLCCSRAVWKKPIRACQASWSRWTEEDYVVFEIEGPRLMTESEVRQVWENDVLLQGVDGLTGPSKWFDHVAQALQAMLGRDCDGQALINAARIHATSQTSHTLATPLWSIELAWEFTIGRRAMLAIWSPVLPPLVLGFLMAYCVETQPHVRLLLDGMFASEQCYTIVIFIDSQNVDYARFVNNLRRHCFGPASVVRNKKLVAAFVVKYMRMFCEQHVSPTDLPPESILEALVAGENERCMTPAGWMRNTPGYLRDHASEVPADDRRIADLGDDVTAWLNAAADDQSDMSIAAFDPDELLAALGGVPDVAALSDELLIERGSFHPTDEVNDLLN